MLESPLHTREVTSSNLVVGTSLYSKLEAFINVSFFISPLNSHRFDIPYNFKFLKRSALTITDTELNVIAALAIIGLSRSPKIGYRTPAAIGTPNQIINKREEQILTNVFHCRFA